MTTCINLPAVTSVSFYHAVYHRAQNSFTPGYSFQRSLDTQAHIVLRPNIGSAEFLEIVRFGISEWQATLLYLGIVF